MRHCRAIIESYVAIRRSMRVDPDSDGSAGLERAPRQGSLEVEQGLVSLDGP